MQEALQRKVQEPVTPNFVIQKRGDDGALHPVLEKVCTIGFETDLYLTNDII